MNAVEVKPRSGCGRGKGADKILLSVALKNTHVHRILTLIGLVTEASRSLEERRLTELSTAVDHSRTTRIRYCPELLLPTTEHLVRCGAAIPNKWLITSEGQGTLEHHRKSCRTFIQSEKKNQDLIDYEKGRH